MHGPLDEVVMGVRFVAPNFSVIDYGLFWDELNERYPNVSTQPPIQHVPEVGGFIFAQSLPRIWYQSADGHFVVQLQADKLVINWRRVNREGTYPRYAAISERFFDALARFEKAVKRLNESYPLVTQQLEFSYVNLIDESLRQAVNGPMFSWESKDWNKMLPSPSGKVVQYNFDFPEDAMRLTATTRPAIEIASQQTITSFQLDARSTSVPDSWEQWYDVAHKKLNEAFKDLLTREACAVWEKIA
jgi:uncharacterized protein (TIGR04255 family)